MSDLADTLRAFISSRKADYITGVRVIEETKSAFLDVPRERIGDKVSKGSTSVRQLDRLASEIKKAHGLTVTFIFRDKGNLAALESGWRVALTRLYPDALSDLDFSFPTNDRVAALFSLSGNSESISGAEVRNAIEDLLKAANFKSVQVEELPADLPSPNLLNILKGLKVCAPVTVDQLASHLKEQGFSFPDNRWLSKKLDSARKRGLVVRSNGSGVQGRYSMSIEGLSVIPAPRRRNSSDIERILALGRRKEW